MTKKRLWVDLSSPTATQLSWLVLNEEGAIQHSVVLGNPTDLQAFAQDHEMTVIIPGQDVLLTRAQLPKLSRPRLLQALPFALEEQLIDDVQQLHFAIGDYQTDGHLPVAIINKNKIQAYLARLQEFNLTPTYMFPSTLLLPHHAKQWEIAILGAVCLIRTDKFQGFACDHPNLINLLTLHYNASAEKPECLHVYHLCHDGIDIHLPSVTTNTIDYREKNFLEIIPHEAHTNPCINLLQGEFASKKISSFHKKMAWMSLAIIFVWVGVLFLNKIVSCVILQNALHQSDLAINTIYKKHFPAASSVIAPRERMEQKLKETNGSSKNSMLGLLGLVGNSLRAFPLIHIKQFDFHEKSLSLTITANSFDQFDKLAQTLKQQGLTVKQQNATMVGNEAKATMNIGV